MTSSCKCLFSIVIPTFNRNQLICDALESITRQKYRPIEVIIIDDGSTDATISTVVDWYGRFSNNFCPDRRSFHLHIFSQTNRGVSAARNHGLARSSGKYIFFLDSDDILEPDTLEAMAEAFEKNNCDLVFGGFRKFDHATGIVTMNKKANPATDLIRDALHGTLWGNAARIAMKRDFALAIGPWDESLALFEDREYSERAILKAQSISILPVSFVRVREGAGPRQNDKLRTRAGRACRIRCESYLAGLAMERVPANNSAWSEFRSRIYGLGLRSYAEGWLEHGRACKTLADGLGARLNRKGLQRKIACQFGVFGGKVYMFAGLLKWSKYL